MNQSRTSSLPVRTRIFAFTAVLLSAMSLIVAIIGFLDSDRVTALLGATVGVFAGWMANAIVQFQERISAIDRLVEEAQRRIDHSDRVIGEVRRIADQTRNDSPPTEDRSVH